MAILIENKSKLDRNRNRGLKIVIKIGFVSYLINDQIWMACNPNHGRFDFEPLMALAYTFVNEDMAWWSGILFYLFYFI